MKKSKSVCYIGNFLPPGTHTPQICDSLSLLFIQKGVRVFKGGRFASPILRVFDMISVIFWNKNRIDYVIIDTFSGKAFYWALCCSIVCRFFRLPYIPILHGGNIPNYFKNKTNTIDAYLMKAQHIICPSKYLFRWALNKNFKPKIIPNPITLHKYTYKPRLKINPKLLWIRRYHEIYNPLLAITVLHILQKQYPGATLTMAGPDNGYQNKCRHLSVKFGVEKKCTFHGLLSKKEMIEVVNKHDVFLNTTNYDNIPTTLIEMAALGIPIISTNVGGIPDVFTNEKTALLVNKNDAQGMAVQILRLLKNPGKFHDLTESARVLATEYSEETVWESWKSIFNQAN